jgi:3-deoxy-manno-octulosonate cytidylyltransferase (CMP-KDO synthetase)
MTDAELPSGSDRVMAAARLYDPQGNYKLLVNIQGDLPTLDPAIIAPTVALLDDSAVQIGTPACIITDDSEITNPNVVKIVASPLSDKRLRGLYFSRAAAPFGDGDFYHHIGLYVWQRDALERFVSLPPSTLEKRERLEQLRALEDGMRIDVALVNSIPFGVDTMEDLERARAILAPQG